MIKHYPSQFVSFEDSRCARVPEFPRIGDDIKISCIITDNDYAPSLEYTVGNVAQTITGQKEGNYVYFVIPAFNKKCEFTYRIVCGCEATKEYVCNVCEEITYNSFENIYVNGDEIYGVLNSKAVACFETADLLRVKCVNTAPKGKKASSVDKTINGKKLSLDATSLWHYGETAAKSITLLLDKDGNAITSKLAINIPGEHIFGTGERFDSVDQKGKYTSGLVEERCFYQEEITYIPIPFFFTEKGYGFVSDSTVPVAMKFENDVVLERDASKEIFSYVFPTGNPDEIIKAYYSVTGQPKNVPEWVFGVWLSANGWNRTEEVYEVLDELQKNDYPASVLVLEPWSDEKTYYDWSENRYKNHEQMMKDVKAKDLHVILWQISAIRRNSICEEEAIKYGYCIKNSDGSPFRIPDGWCHDELIVDFTNPDAKKWWFEPRKKLLDEGVEGFKTDGGEFLMDKTAIQADGLNGLEARNVHTLQYQKAYQDFMEENGVNGVTFSRSGFAGAQCVPIHWAGDQSSEWRELRGHLVAGITSGLSGIIFWSFDIGSLGGPLPNKELYLRATAFATFCPVMQWHSMVMPDQLAPRYDKMSYNDRSPWNLARQFNDDEILEKSTYFAKLRHSLIPYIKKEADYCVQNGRPLMAQLCIDFPSDKNAWKSYDEYMFGRELLVAPIYTEGSKGRDVYLPEGKWEDFFTHTEYRGNQTVYIECALDKIPVFRRKA